MAVLQSGMTWGQPQFRNTTSFDTGDSLYYWSARIGARTYQDSVYTDTTTGYHVMSTCGYSTDLMGDSVIKSVYVWTTFYVDTVDVTVYDSIEDELIDTIRIDTISFYTDTCRDYGIDASMYRFYIYNQSTAGMDQFTVDTMVSGSGMPRVAPGYETSIRLGCMVNSRSGLKVDSNDNLVNRVVETLLRVRRALSEGVPLSVGQVDTLSTYPGLTDTTDTAAFVDELLEMYQYGSQSLFYTMRVTEENALLIINYAIVARRYDHTAYDAGEFLVRIVRRDSTGEWADEPINDNLWYKISAPQLTVDESTLAPWRVGSTGTYWPCRYVYKPWNKCAVNLSEYIGEDVRVEFYTSTCIYGVDPLYAYIAGDYTSPTISASGCPMDASPFIDSLRAPEGLVGYEWFVSAEGPQDDLTDYAHLDTVNFRRLTPIVTSHIYCPTINDFISSNRDTLTYQTFMCIMHSALDPAKPFTSRLYANVYNHKPMVRCEVKDSCDRSLTFISHARAPIGDSLDPSSLYWVVYDDLNGEVVLDTLYGDSVRYRFPEVRSYMVEQSVAIHEPDSTLVPCRGARRSFFPVKGPTDVGVGLSAHAICTGTELTANALFDSAARAQWRAGTLQMVWRVDGMSLQESTTEHRVVRDTVLLLPSLGEGMHVIEIQTRNRFGCQSSMADTVYVYDNPRIVVDPQSRMLCLGDTLTLSAFRDDQYLDSAWFDWTIEPPDPTFAGQEGRPVLHLLPTENSTYTLHPSPLSHCQQHDITVRVEVYDYPVPAVSYHPMAIDIDRPTVTLEDETPGAWRSRWTFDDGAVVSGPRASHVFASPSLEGVDVLLNTCNRALCCDTVTVHIPVTALSVWVPNVFVPGDEDNGFFYVQSNQELLDFEIVIYNRRGLRVYNSRDAGFRWDGTDARGIPLPQETYVYLMTYRMPSTGNYRYSARGTVTLLR